MPAPKVDRILRYGRLLVLLGIVYATVRTVRTLVGTWVVEH